MSAQTHVLVVDDDPGDVLLLQEAIRELGLSYRLELRSDGEAACERLLEDPVPDLIVLDLNLPRRSGREVFARIRALPRLRAVPVAVLTTSKTDSDIIAGADPALNCYLTKPMRLEGFLHTVRDIDAFLRARPARADIRF